MSCSQNRIKHKQHFFRIAKLKGITSGPPSECGDDNEKPKDSKRSSKNCESKDDDKYIDYKGEWNSIFLPTRIYYLNYAKYVWYKSKTFFI